MYRNLCPETYLLELKTKSKLNGVVVYCYSHLVLYFKFGFI